MAEQGSCPECGARPSAESGQRCGCAGHGAPGAPEDERLHVRPYVDPSEPEDPIPGVSALDRPVQGLPEPAASSACSGREQTGRLPPRRAELSGESGVRPPWYRRPAAVVSGVGAAAVLCAVVVTGVLLSEVPDGDERGTAAHLPRQRDFAEPSAAPSGAAPSPSSADRGPVPRSEVRVESATQPPPPLPTRTTRPASPPASAPPVREEVLRLGDSGADVRELVLRLRAASMLTPGYPETDTFTPEVQAGVVRFQHERDVRGDVQGEYGEPTRTALEAETPQVGPAPTDAAAE